MPQEVYKKRMEIRNLIRVRQSLSSDICLLNYYEDLPNLATMVGGEEEAKDAHLP